MSPLLNVVVALVLAPLMLGLVTRTKALVAGRNGAPLVQPYRDIWKLLRKGAVYSRTTTALFGVGPVVGCAAVVVALAVVPFAGAAGPLSFAGDLLVVAGLLALARFVTVLAALDTGSAFEGMGGSREVLVAALAEPALLLGLLALSWRTGSSSLGQLYGRVTPSLWGQAAAPLTLVVVALAIVYLAENCRIPVDDPTTHLELTMIHEVMVLDHGGPDLGLILYGAALKLWAIGALVVGLVVPVAGLGSWPSVALSLGGMVALAVATGLVESGMARLRLPRLPQLLTGAVILAVIAVMLVAR
jgi:formate hydrogenlyase subunit 4